MQSQQSQTRQLTSRKPQALLAPREGSETRALTKWPTAGLRGLALGNAFPTILRSRWLKIAGGAAATLAIALICVNLLFSTDWAKARVAAHIKEQTGRDLVVNGPTHLALLPGPRIVISDATLTNPGARSGAVELSIARLTVDLSIIDLFGDQVEVERIVLERPILTLQAGRQAQARILQGAPGPKKPRFVRAQLGGDASAPPSDARIEDPRIEDLRIEHLQIVDGTVIFAQSDSTKKRRLENIDASVSLTSLRAPVVGHGTFRWKREPVDFSFEFATPADLRAKRPGALQVALDTKVVEARFDGSIATAPHLAGEGRISAKASSIPSLLAWLRGRTDVPPTIGDGELDGLIAWTNDEITLSETRFASEYGIGEGEAVITLKDPRPHIRAALAFDYLDASPFLQDTDQTGTVGQDGPPRDDDLRAGSDPAIEAAAFTEPAAPAAEVEQAVSPPPPFAPQVPTPEQQVPTVQRAPSLAQPSLSLALPMPDAEIARATTPQMPHEPRPALFDADVNLNVRKARFDQLDIGPSALGLVFHSGTLKATLSGMSLYGGDAHGTLTVDTSQPAPRFEGEFGLDGVQARPFLTDAAQFGMIAGSTKLTLSVSGEGANAEAIKSSLKGNGAVVVTQGAIGGIDITAFIRSLGEGEFDLRQGADAKTAFSELGGSFTIDDGIAKTGNLQMLSPLLRVSAEGDVNLPGGTLQFLATPEILAAPEGDGANDLAGLSVPVRIEGPLDSPRIRPQIDSVFANPKSASRAVSKIGAALQKKFKGKTVGEFIGRFLGGANPGAAAPQALAPPHSAAPQDSNVDAATDPALESPLR